MTNDAPTPGSSDDRDVTELTAALEELSGRLEHWHEAEISAGVLRGVVSDLDVAHEELRVADERVREQAAELDFLSREQQSVRFWEERLMAALPSPVVVTNPIGRIQSVNAAASVLFNVPVSQLLGKPLQVLVQQDERQGLRDAMSAGISPTARLRVVASLAPRGLPAVSADLSGTPRVGPDGVVRQITWVIFALPTSAATGAIGDAATIGDIGAALNEMLQLPVYTQDRETLIRQMAHVCSTALGSDVAVSVTMGEPIEPSMIGTDDELAQWVDGLQMRADEGPCQRAYQERRTIVSSDLTRDERWPRLAGLLVDHDVGAALAVPIESGTEVVGAVNAYTLREAQFDPRTIQLAELLGGAISAVLHEIQQVAELERTKEQLENALKSRAVIDQAKGILMARMGISADEAFALLAQQSRDTNVKVRHLAAALVAEVSRQSPHIRA